MKMGNPENDCITYLKNDPISFAMMMDDEEIEEIIVAFVSVLQKRKRIGGGQN